MADRPQKFGVRRGKLLFYNLIFFKPFFLGIFGIYFLQVIICVCLCECPEIFIVIIIKFWIERIWIYSIMYSQYYWFNQNISNFMYFRHVLIVDGNPVTGEGYKAAPAEINTTVPSLNGSNQVINKNRVPPGGFSSGLW